VTDFLAEKRDEIATRLKELRPVVDEYNRLEAAAQALAGVSGAAPAAANGRRRRGPGRPPGSKTTKPLTTNVAAAKPAGRKRAAAKPTASKPASQRRGRRRGTGERATEALQIVVDNPGITIPEIAGKMGIKQNYLYRVLPGLEGEGKIEKQGRSWHPVLVAA
jgi:hypothetical protein